MTVRTNAHIPARAFTLLEVVVALTIMATVFGLLSALWYQAADWNTERLAVERAVRVDRFERILQRQWAARLDIPATETRGSIPVAAIKPGALVFATDAPLLLHDAAFVVATLSIEPPPGEVVFPERTPQTLVYREHEVLRPAELWLDIDRVRTALRDGLATDGRAASLDALTDARGLRFEVWKAGFEVREGERPGWSPIAPGEFQPPGVDFDPDPEDDEGIAATAAPPSGPADPDDVVDAEADDRVRTNLPRAVRLIGRHNGREVQWPLIDRASR